MSLGSWFRDYVYIPLGGNRVSTGRHLFNILVVWMLTGFWHGAAWTFIAWGLFFALLLVAEKLWLLKPLKKVHVLNHLYVILAILVSFVIFDASGMTQALSRIGAMFGAGDYPLISGEALYYLESYRIVLLLAVIGATPLPQRMWHWLESGRVGKIVVTVVEPIAVALLLVLCTAYLVDGSYNPFLYFRF